MIAAAAALLVACVASRTIAAEGRWSSDAGDGFRQARVAAGPGNEIVVTCDTGGGAGNAIEVFVGGATPASGSLVSIIFDRAGPEEVLIDGEGSITTDSRETVGTFIGVIDGLKRHNRVTLRLADGREAVFSLKGSSKAIGDCPTLIAFKPSHTASAPQPATAAFDSILLFGNQVSISEPFLEATDLTWADVKDYSYSALPNWDSTALSPEETRSRIEETYRAKQQEYEAYVQALHVLLRPLIRDHVARTAEAQYVDGIVENYDIEVASALRGGTVQEFLETLGAGPGYAEVMAHPEQVAHELQALQVLSGNVVGIEPAATAAAAPAVDKPASPPQADQQPASATPTVAGAEQAPQEETAAAGPQVEVFRLQDCDAARGVGIVDYSLSGASKKAPLQERLLSDLCFNEETGLFTFTEKVKGFQLVAAGAQEGSTFETTQTTPKGDRETLVLRRIFFEDDRVEDQVEAAALRRVWWHSAIGYKNGRVLDRNHFEGAGIMHGFLGGEAYTAALPEGEYRAYLSVSMEVDNDDLFGGLLPEEQQIIGVFHMEGTLRSAAGKLEGRLQLDDNTHSRNVGAEVSLTVSDGEISGTIAYAAETARLAGFKDTDWTGLDGVMHQILGRVVGEAGNELYLVGLEETKFATAGGSEHPIWANASMIAVRLDGAAQ